MGEVLFHASQGISSLGARIFGKFQPKHSRADDNEDDDHAFYTYVRGMRVPFSLAVIQQYYQVVEGIDVLDIEDGNQVIRCCFNEDITLQWPHSNIVMHNELNLKLKVVHYILTYNIAPSSHMTEIRHSQM